MPTAYKLRTLLSVLLLLFLTVSCQVNAVKNAAPKAKAHANSPSKTAIVNGTVDASISPQQYAASLGKGIDVTWAETMKGIETYNIKMVRDFKQAGLRHVRIRVKHESDAKLLAHLAFNADHKYYDAQKLTWIDSVKPVFDEILQTNC